MPEANPLDLEDDLIDDRMPGAWNRLRGLIVSIRHEFDSIRHEFDKRISIVEVRMSDQDDRLERIEADLQSTQLLAQKVLEVLHAHMEQEHKDRVQLLRWIIATLLSVLGFAGLALFDHWLP